MHQSFPALPPPAEAHQPEASDGSQGPVVRRVLDVVKGAFVDDLQGPFAEEMRASQRDVMLRRTVILIWISVFVMPSTIWAFFYLTAPQFFVHAVVVVLAAIVAVMLLRVLVLRGFFTRHYQLPMLLLVGGVFAPTGTAVVEMAAAAGGDFFLAYFLVYFAFTSLFPASPRWILATSGVIVTSFVVGEAVTPPGIVVDQTFVGNVLYLFQLTFIGLVLNRVLCKLFFSELQSRIELRNARDALLLEMEVARQIQTMLLPEDPAVTGHEVKGRMVPAAEVGGDYYDVIETQSGRQFVVIGDVSGHGLTAGLTMMMVRASLIGTIEADPTASLHAVYAAVNRSLRRNLKRMGMRMYMTFALFEYMGRGAYHGIGAHPAPLVYRQRTRSVEAVGILGTWLGVVDEVPAERLPVSQVALEPGDVLLLYTDGLTESQRDGEMFGLERLMATIVEHAEDGPEMLIDELIAAVQAYAPEQDDDMTLLVLRYLGEGGNVGDGGKGGGR